MTTDYQPFQNLCIGILAQSDNCMESQQMFRRASSIRELVSAWRKYWAGMMREVPAQVIEAFSYLYNIYGKEINREGLYYNEAPTQLFSVVTILVGDCDHPITVRGRSRVYIIGKAEVNAHDNVFVECHSEEAIVHLHGNSRAVMNAGTCHAHERSSVNGKGKLFSYDSSTILISGGTLEDHGHYRISAFNDSVVHSFTRLGIFVNDSARLIIKQER